MKLSRILKYVILLASVVMIVAGVMTGEAQAVLSKATRVCLECIGVG